MIAGHLIEKEILVAKITIMYGRNCFKVLSPTAILGYGFPEEPFIEGMNKSPDLVGVDAASTDPGPYYLGASRSFTSRAAVKRDLTILLEADFFTPALIGKLYQIHPRDVTSLVYFEPAFAVKVTVRRWVPSGNIGDTDIYGAQQHAPLLGLVGTPNSTGD